MATRQISCPHCGQVFALDEAQVASYLDRQVSCSKCRQTFLVLQAGADIVAVKTSSQAAPPLPPTPPSPAGSKAGGMAIAGLICGCVGFPSCGLTAIAGLVCSLVAMRKAKAAGQKSGMALAGLIVSIIALAFSVLGLAVFLPALSHARAAATRIACQGNLQQIGMGIVMYRNDNRDYLPPDLNSLNAYVGKGQVFRCPAAGSRSSGASVSDYIYLGPLLSRERGGRIRNPSAAVLVYEPLENHDGTGMCVLCADGHTEWLEKARAEKLLAEIDQRQYPPQLPPGGRQ